MFAVFCALALVQLSCAKKSAEPQLPRNNMNNVCPNGTTSCDMNMNPCSSGYELCCDYTSCCPAGYTICCANDYVCPFGYYCDNSDKSCIINTVTPLPTLILATTNGAMNFRASFAVLLAILVITAAKPV